MRESKTYVIIGALRQAANDIHDEEGTTRAMMLEAAERMEELIRPVRWTSDGRMAECAHCGSRDVGATSVIAHCYKCKISVRGNNMVETLTLWNTRGGKLLLNNEAKDA